MDLGGNVGVGASRDRVLEFRGHYGIRLDPLFESTLAELRMILVAVPLLPYQTRETIIGFAQRPLSAQRKRPPRGS